MNNLNDERYYDNYDEWLHVGMCLYTHCQKIKINIDNEKDMEYDLDEIFLEMWDNWSS